MEKVTIYLAGDISKEERWRPDVIEALKKFEYVSVLSPVDLISYVPKKLRSANDQNAVFVDCDLFKIDRCDVLFAYLRSCGSWHSGTSAEVGYAFKSHKTIILINEMKDDQEVYFSFIRGMVPSRRYFRKLKDGILYLEEFLVELSYRP